jgi:hypothetical protein
MRVSLFICSFATFCNRLCAALCWHFFTVVFIFLLLGLD